MTSLTERLILFALLVPATLAGRDVVQTRSSAAGGVEMPGYMTDIQASRELDPVGRVVVLEDVDDDGKMDKRTVFAGLLHALRYEDRYPRHPNAVMIKVSTRERETEVQLV